MRLQRVQFCCYLHMRYTQRKPLIYMILDNNVNINDERLYFTEHVYWAWDVSKEVAQLRLMCQQYNIDECF